MYTVKGSLEDWFENPFSTGNRELISQHISANIICQNVACTLEDMHSIGSWLKGSTNYYLQSYKDSGDILKPGLKQHDKNTLLTCQSIVQPYFETVAIRGIDS